MDEALSELRRLVTPRIDTAEAACAASEEQLASLVSTIEAHGDAARQALRGVVAQDKLESPGILSLLVSYGYNGVFRSLLMLAAVRAPLAAYFTAAAVGNVTALDLMIQTGGVETCITGPISIDQYEVRDKLTVLTFALRENTAAAELILSRLAARSRPYSPTAADLVALLHRGDAEALFALALALAAPLTSFPESEAVEYALELARGSTSWALPPAPQSGSPRAAVMRLFLKFARDGTLFPALVGVGDSVLSLAGACALVRVAVESCGVPVHAALLTALAARAPATVTEADARSQCVSALLSRAPSSEALRAMFPAEARAAALRAAAGGCCIPLLRALLPLSDPPAPTGCCAKPVRTESPAETVLAILRGLSWGVLTPAGARDRATVLDMLLTALEDAKGSLMQLRTADTSGAADSEARLLRLSAAAGATAMCRALLANKPSPKAITDAMSAFARESTARIDMRLRDPRATSPAMAPALRRRLLLKDKERAHALVALTHLPPAPAWMPPLPGALSPGARCSGCGATWAPDCHPVCTWLSRYPTEGRTATARILLDGAATARNADAAAARAAELGKLTCRTDLFAFRALLEAAPQNVLVSAALAQPPSVGKTSKDQGDDDVEDGPGRALLPNDLILAVCGCSSSSSLPTSADASFSVAPHEAPVAPTLAAFLAALPPATQETVANATSSSGISMLQAVVSAGHVTLVPLLLRAGARVCRGENFGGILHALVPGASSDGGDCLCSIFTALCGSITSEFSAMEGYDRGKWQRKWAADAGVGSALRTLASLPPSPQSQAALRAASALGLG